MFENVMGQCLIENVWGTYCIFSLSNIDSFSAWSRLLGIVLLDWAAHERILKCDNTIQSSFKLWRGLNLLNNHYFLKFQCNNVYTLLFFFFLIGKFTRTPSWFCFHNLTFHFFWGEEMLFELELISFFFFLVKLYMEL